MEGNAGLEAGKPVQVQQAMPMSMELRSLLSANGVPEQVVQFLEAEGCLEVKLWARWISSRAEIQSAILDKLSAFKSSRVTLAALVQAHKEAEAIVLAKLKYTVESSNQEKPPETQVQMDEKQLCKRCRAALDVEESAVLSTTATSSTRVARARTKTEALPKASDQAVLATAAKQRGSTATHTEVGVRICKKYNDGRGCCSPCPSQAAHVCDLVLKGTKKLCGSKTHNRKGHIVSAHGVVAARE